MEMRKQGSDAQGTARSASKSPGKKPAGEQMSSSASATQGAAQATAAAPSTSGNQGTAGDQRTSGAQGGEQDLLQHAKQAGGEIVTQVQQRAGSQFTRQKEAAASEITNVANAVRRLRESLGGEQSGTIAQYAADYGDKAAERLERLSNYIREQDPKQMLDDVQNFGRRRPALLLGGAFLLGFAGARMIKSSMNMGSQQQSSRMDKQSSNFAGTNVPGARQSGVPNAV